jgi:hypothetical protein
MPSHPVAQEPGLKQPTTQPPADSDRRRSAIGSELQKVLDRATENAQRERRTSSRWSSLYFFVGLPAAILAAIAGATALASTAGRVPAGIIALTSSALAAAATFLDSQTRQRSHENLAAGWQVLANDAHVHLIVNLEDPEWLQRNSRLELQGLLDRERKLLEGKAPDAEAEAERRAQTEAMRAQSEANRAEAEAERARAAEERAQANERAALNGQLLAQSLKAMEPIEPPDDTTGRLQGVVEESIKGRPRRRLAIKN